MALHYDKTGRTYEADEDAFDEKGLLKDGKSLRIPVYLRDSATVGGISLEDAVDLLKEVFPEDRRILLADIGRQVGRRSGYVADSVSVSDKVRCRNARDAYINEINDAWRGGQVIDGSPGDVCTTNSGQPGKLCTTNGKLVFVPLSTKSKEPSDREWEMGGPLSDSVKDRARVAARDAERAVADAARAEYIDRLQNGWKR